MASSAGGWMLPPWARLSCGLMSDNVQNRPAEIHELLHRAVKSMVAARKQSESGVLASRYAIAGQRSGVAAAASVIRENQKTIREAQDTIRRTHAAELSRFIQEAKKTSWSAATPRQRLLGPSPTMLAELAENKRLIEESRALTALSEAKRQDFLDITRRTTEDHQAQMAAIRANPQTSILQSLATQAAKAKAISDAIERAGQTPTIADYGRVESVTRMASGEVIRSTGHIPPLDLAALVPSGEQQESIKRLFKDLDRVEGAWADDALWFVFSRLTHKSMFLFNRLPNRERVEAATLDALERVFREGTFIRGMRDKLGEAPYMSDYQREILDHALDHVQKGDYRLAISHLLDGLEGALIRAAIERSVIDRDRWLIGKPKAKKNRRHGVDAIVKEMSLDDEYKRFLHRGVFGTRGNSARHGNVQGNERRRALLSVVALAGWMDVFMANRASASLVNAMSVYLPDTVSRQRLLTA